MTPRVATPVQARLLRFLRKAEEEGRSPSFREIAGAFGWSAVSTVRDHVAGLQAKGLVTSVAKQARSLRLTEQGRAEAVPGRGRRVGAGGAVQPETLADASQEIMELLAPWLRTRDYAKGAVLWFEGETADRLALVDAGRFWAFRRRGDGKVAPGLQFAPGEVLGFAPFFDGGGYPATVQALEPSRIRYIVHRDLLRAMREPRVAKALLGFMARRLRKAYDTIEQLSQRASLPRVATALQSLSAGGAVRLLTLPGSAASYAEALGIAPATLSRVLALLVRQGILHKLGLRRYQVLKPRALERLAEGENDVR